MWDSSRPVITLQAVQQLQVETENCEERQIRFRASIQQRFSRRSVLADLRMPELDLFVRDDVVVYRLPRRSQSKNATNSKSLFNQSSPSSFLDPQGYR